jgi:hypothetical protein
VRNDFGRLSCYVAAPAMAVLLAVGAADPGGQPGGDAFAIRQQTAYQVDPVKIRVAGREDFKVHRLEVAATVPAYAKPVERRDPARGEAGPVRANGTITFFGRCTSDEGLWHWGDCRSYAASFSLDVRVGRRYEYDPSGLHRPGYVIVGVKGGNLYDIDADGKVLFFNGPATTTEGPHCGDCPYRLVINAKSQKEVVQAITMEPVRQPPASPRP